MARHTFFSFHYERDVWRAGQVRNSWMTQDRKAAGFWDSASWEEVKRKGDAAVRSWIDSQLHGTSVTVVLIGAETADRAYVRYEIEQSHKRENGMLGIFIHLVKDANGHQDHPGRSPFDSFTFTDSKGNVVLYPTYDWVNDRGRENIGVWIEQAAVRAGRG